MTNTAKKIRIRLPIKQHKWWVETSLRSEPVINKDFSNQRNTGVHPEKHGGVRYALSYSNCDKMRHTGYVKWRAPLWHRNRMCPAYRTSTLCVLSLNFLCWDTKQKTDLCLFGCILRTRTSSLITPLIVAGLWSLPAETASGTLYARKGCHCCIGFLLCHLNASTTVQRTFYVKLFYNALHRAWQYRDHSRRRNSVRQCKKA